MDDYDLRHRRWAPVHYIRGDTGHTGLQGLIAEAELIRSINAPMPPGYAALWHVLTALTYRITRLDTQDEPYEWLRRRDQWLAHGTFTSVPPGLRGTWPEDPAGDPVEQYFSRFADRFALFGARPFLQDIRLRDQCVKTEKKEKVPDTSGVNKFVLGRPVGENGATWWTRHHDGDQRPVPPGEAIWWLLVQWYYGAAGKITAREVNGKKTSDSKSGMLRGTISYYPRGHRLFDSLLISLVPPAGAQPEDTAAAGPDLCPWERKDLPDPDAPPRPGGMCSLLTAVHKHSFLLVPDLEGNVADVYRTWAYRAAAWPERLPANPFLAYRVDGEAPRPRRAQPGRALWRDLDGLLPQAQVSAGQTQGRRRAVYRRPAFLDEFAEIGTRRGIVAVGFHQDPKTVDHEWWMAASPQALMDCFDAENPEYYHPQLARAAVRILDRLERAWLTLKICLGRAWTEGTRGDSDSKLSGAWPAQAEPVFWEQAERFFERRLRAEADASPSATSHPQGGVAEESRPSVGNDAEAETERQVRGLVRRIYDEVTAVVVARQPGEVDPYLQMAVLEHRPHTSRGRPFRERNDV
ncbi:type I-E CRISPR-associated protein Cse1/CasA [Nocardiopsis sp. NPDC049922]|uniref:type I-E CRISPR-associated protein Cse1/CasA n=1 Tax=Nocardiopsis sp. NPDC049922 TaxID=3155157 RepID=UPI003401FA6A